MYFVYSKTFEDKKFWESDNVKIYGGFQTYSEAEKSQKDLCQGYIVKQEESGYKSRIENKDVLVISKDVLTISKGYLWNSTIITKNDVISFHICYCSKKIEVPSEPKIEKQLPSHNVVLIKVLNELKDKLQQKYSSQVITEDE